MKRPIVWCVSAFILGIILYLNFSVGLAISVFSGILYTFFAYKSKAFLILIPVLLLGMLSCFIFDSTNTQNPKKYDGQTISINFKVTEILDGKYKIEIDKPIKSTGYLYTYNEYSLFDESTADVNFKAVANFSKSNSFDYKTYLYNKGIFFTAIQKSDKGKITSGAPDIFEGISLLRYSLLERTKKISSHKNFGLFSAIIAGDKSNLSADIKNDFRKIGISHILAVSGLHISIVLGMLTALLGAFRIKKFPKVIICTVFLVAIIPFMNSSPSVIRASVMGIILLWSEVVRGDNDSVTALAVAGLLILIFRPYSVFDAGTILSFTATAGIILVSPLIDRLFLKMFKHSFPMLSVLLAAQLSIIPANIYCTGEFSYISLFTNLIFVPVFPLIIFLLLIAVLLGGIFPIFATILNTATDIYTGAASELARIPNIVSNFGKVDVFIVLTALPILLCFLFGKKMRPLLACVALIFITISSINIYTNMMFDHILIIPGDNVQAMAVKSEDKAYLIFDASPQKSSEYDAENIIAYLDKKGIKKLDFVYPLKSNSNADRLIFDLQKEFDFSKLSDGEYNIGDGIKLTAKDGHISLDGKKTIALTTHIFQAKEKAQICYETGTKTLSTVFKDNNGDNLDIIFNKDGAKMLRAD